MRRSADGLLLVLAVAALAPGCSLLPKKSIQRFGRRRAERAVDSPGRGRDAARRPRLRRQQIPEEYTKPGTTLSLGQLVDVALKNNPATREAWYFARAAAAEVGSKRSLYFPYVEVDGFLERQKQSDVGGQFTFIQTTYGPSAAATWLLFNFGEREAEVEEATRSLYAADWTHNAAIQDVVLQVAQAYYQYLNAKAQVAARETNLEEAKSNLAAAEERHRAGVATIADVLLARTSASQVGARAPGRAGPGADRPRRARHRRSASTRTCPWTSAACPRSCRSTP